MQAECLEVCVTLLILYYLIGVGMTVAVYFNDERLFQAIKVHDVWPNAMLPTKIESLKLSCPQF